MENCKYINLPDFVSNGTCRTWIPRTSAALSTATWPVICKKEFKKLLGNYFSVKYNLSFGKVYTQQLHCKNYLSTYRHHNIRMCYPTFLSGVECVCLASKKKTITSSGCHRATSFLRVSIKKIATHSYHLYGNRLAQKYVCN